MAGVNLASRASSVRSQFFTNPKGTGNANNDDNHTALFTGLTALSQQVSQDSVSPIVFATAANPGDAISIASVAGVATASAASALVPAYASCFLLERQPVAIGDIGLVQFYGLNQFLSGLIPGSRYYLSDTLGGYSLTPRPNKQAVGIALTANTMLFFPQVIS